MAVKFIDNPTRGNVYSFYPEDIIVRPEDNGRFDEVKQEEFHRLVKSIQELGQIQSVTIRNEGGKAVLVAGFTRWRAIQYINASCAPAARLKVNCVFQPATGLEAIMVNVSENIIRNATTQLDDALNMDRMMRSGKTIEEVAEFYGVKVSGAKKLLKLLQLTPEWQQRLKNGEIKGPAALKIAKLTLEEQKKALESGEVDKPEKPKGPGKKAVFEVLQRIADSTAHAKSERSFAEKILKFLSGEITAEEII